MPPNKHHFWLDSLEQVRAYLAGDIPSCEFQGCSKKQRITWVHDTLDHFNYDVLPRADKGTLREFIQKASGYSRAQVARHITAHRVQSTADAAVSVATEAVEQVADGMRQVTVHLRVPTKDELRRTFKEWGSFAAMMILVAGAMVRASFASPDDALKFLNSEIDNLWQVGSEEIALFPEDLRSPGISRRISSVRSLTPTNDGTPDWYASPLFMVHEEISHPQSGEMRMYRSLASSANGLLTRMQERRARRIASRPPEEIRAFQYTFAPPSMVTNISQKSTTTQLVPHEVSGEPPVNNFYYNTGTHAAAPTVFDTLGLGADGQVIAIVNGEIQWTYLGGIPNQRGGITGIGNSRSGGSRRGGGGSGGGGSSTTTTVTNNTTTTIENDGGFSDDGSVVRLTTSTDSVGIGTDSADTKLEVVGTISGSSLTISGLKGCDTIDTDANGNLSCGTDDGAGTGISRAEGDARYVEIGGDTMTGALQIHHTNGLTVSGSVVFNSDSKDYNDVQIKGATQANLFYSDASTDRIGIGTATPDTLLEVIGIISGSHLHAQDLLTSSGGVIAEGASRIHANLDVTGTLSGASLTIMENDSYILGNLGIGTSVTPDAALEVIGTISGSTLFAMSSLFSSGTLVVEGLGRFNNNVDVAGTLSGSVIHAERELTASGTFIAEGNVRFNSGVIINGVTYSFPGSDGSATGKILATDGNGNLSWTDDTGTTYEAGRGIGLDGNNVFTLNTTITGSLVDFTTISGATVAAANSLTSSGTLVAEGDATFHGTISGAVINIQGGNSYLLGNVSVGTSTNADTKLEVIGTASGIILHAQDELRSSGSLIVDGSTFYLNSFDCSGNANGGTLTVDANGQVSCADDDGGSVSAGQGISVNGSVVSLSAVHSGTTITATTLLSGASVHAQNLLTSSGTIVIEGTSFFHNDAQFFSLLSGAKIHASTLLTSSGGLIASGSNIIFSNFANCNLDTDANGNLVCGEDATGGSSLSAGQGITIASDVVSLNSTITGSLVSFTTVSGAHVHAQDLLTSSGAVIAEGDATFHGTISGAVITVQSGNSYLLGNVSIGDSANADTKLEVIGTASGIKLHAQDRLTSSGDLVVDGSSIYLNSFDCTGNANGGTLTVDANGLVSCADDDSGGSISAGQGITVNGSVVSLTAAHSGTTIEAVTLLSGATVHAQDHLSASGTVSIFGRSDGTFADVLINSSTALIHLGSGAVGPHGIGFGDSTGEGLQLVYRTGPNQLIVEKEDDFNDNEDLFSIDYDTEYSYFKGNVGVGTASPETKLEVIGVGSGRHLHAQDLLTSSGQLVIEGASYYHDDAQFFSLLSGAKIHASTLLTSSGGLIASGSNIIFSNFANCNLDTDANGNLVCGTDSGDTVEAGQGITVASSVISLNSTITGSLVSFTTVSGAKVHAQDLLTSSGAIIAEGNATFHGTISGATLTVQNGNSYPLGNVSIGNSANADTKLEVIGTASGITLHAQDRLTSSGDLVIDGSTFYLNGFNCSGNANGGTLTVDANGQVSCADDDGGSVSAGQGITVNGSVVSLTAAHSGTTIEATTLLSGAHVHAQSLLTASGTVVLTGTDTVGVGSSTSSGPNNPSDGRSVSNGSPFVWSDPGNITSQNDTYASLLNGAASSTTEYLTASGFSFAIPGDATVTGILVEIDKYEDATTGEDSEIKIIKDGVIGSTNKASGAWQTSDTDTYDSYGGSSDLWGETWSPSDINSDQFGVALVATVDTGSVYVDHIRVTVYYTTAATELAAVVATNGKLGVRTRSPETELEVVGTASASTLHAQNLLTSSGTIVIEGTSTFHSDATFYTMASGARLHASTLLTSSGGLIASGSTIIFSNFANCNLDTDANGNLVCGEDATGGSTLSAGQGITIASDVVSLNSTITGSLVSFTTVSGAHVHAQDLLTSSGTLIVESTSTLHNDVYVGGASESTADIFLGADGAAVFNEQSNNVDFRVESNLSTHMLWVDASDDAVIMGSASKASSDFWLDGTEGAVFNDAGVSTNDLRVESNNNANALLVDASADAVGILTSAPETELEVIGTISGAKLHAQDLLTSSGGLIASGSTIIFSNFANCNLDTDASGNLTCGTDATGAAVIPRGYIDGLILSNNATDSEHDIDISAGEARDSGDDTTIALTATFTKRIDLDWAEGDDGGGLATGARSVAHTPNANTWYHVFVLYDTDDGSVDAGFDTSITATNLLTDASDYEDYRRIGSIRTDVSNNILGFSQVGNEFLWDDPFYQDFLDNNPGTTRQTKTLTVPTDVNVHVIGTFIAIETSVGGTSFVIVNSADQDDVAPDSSNYDLRVASGTAQDSTGKLIRTNTSAQITYRSSRSDTDSYFIYNTNGWFDPRGKEGVGGGGGGGGSSLWTDASSHIDYAGTASAATLHAQDLLTSSGQLVIEGASYYHDDAQFFSLLSGAKIHASTLLTSSGGLIASGSTIIFSNFANCNLDTDANGNLVCGTDATGGGGDGSIVDHYVLASGDTMTGGLLIHSTNDGSATIDSGLLLEVSGVASGLTLHVKDLLTSSGATIIETNVNTTGGGGTPTPSYAAALSVLNVDAANLRGTGAVIETNARHDPVLALNSYGSGSAPHLLFGYKGQYDVSLYRASGRTAGSLGVLRTDQILVIGNEFNVLGTASGYTLHAQNRLTSSGVTIIETNVNTTGGGGTPTPAYHAALIVINDDAANLRGTGAVIETNARHDPILALNGYNVDGSAPHILFGYKGTYDTALFRTTHGTAGADGILRASTGLEVDGTLSGATLQIMSDGSNILGSLEIAALGSGRQLHAQDLLTSSGATIIETNVNTSGGGGTPTPAYHAAFKVINADAANLRGTGAVIETNARHDPVLALNGYSGTGSAPHILFGYKGLYDVKLFRASGAILTTDATFAPEESNRYDLGRDAARWRDLYLSGGTIYLGDATIKFDQANSKFAFSHVFDGEFAVSSGAHVRAEDLLTSSGATIIETNVNTTGGGGTPTPSYAAALSVLNDDAANLRGTGAVIETNARHDPVLALNGYNVDGSAPHILFGYKGQYDASLFRTTHGTAGASGALKTFNKVIIANDLTVEGALSLGSTVEANTLSGLTLRALDLFTSSGQTIIDVSVDTSGGGGTPTPSYQAALKVINTDTAALRGTGALIETNARHDPVLALNSYGSGSAPHLLFGYKGQYDTNLYRSKHNTAGALAALKTDNSLYVGGDLEVSGTFAVTGTLEAATLSGLTLRALDLLTSSGAGIFDVRVDTTGGGGTPTPSYAAALSVINNDTAALRGTGAVIETNARHDPVLALNNYGSGSSPHILFGYKGQYDTKLYRAPNGTAGAIGALKTDSLFVADSLKIINDATFLNNIEISGLGSGVHLHAQDLLTSSGHTIIETNVNTTGGGGTPTPAYAAALHVLNTDTAALRGTGAVIDTNARHDPVLALNGHSGTGSAPHLLFGYKGQYDVRLYRASGAMLTTNTHFIPETDDMYDLGRVDRRWRDLYLGPSSLHIGNSTADEIILSWNGTNLQADGTSFLLEGDDLDLSSESISELLDGASVLTTSSTLSDLSDGSSAMISGTATVSDLSDGASVLTTSSTLSDLSDGSSAMISGTATVSDLSDGTDVLTTSSSLSDLSDGSSAMISGTSTLSDLSDGSSALISGTSSLSDLSDGSSALISGTATLSDLSDGSDPSFTSLTVTGLTDCDTIDTDSSGIFSCGTDAGADLAEEYPTLDLSLGSGDVLALDPDNPVYVKRATGAEGERLIGIFSTKPAKVLRDPTEFPDAHKIPVALTGRVPVKIALEGGDISIGDPITMSSTAGIAKRATDEETRIGYALDSYNGSSSGETIRVYVTLQEGQKTPALIVINSEETDPNADLIRLSSNVNGSGDTVFRVNAAGNVYADGTFNSTGADYAEWFFSNDNDLQEGELVCIDLSQDNAVQRCTDPADANVMGIISTNPAFIGNNLTGADGLPVPGYVLVGLIGQVPARVTNEAGVIRPGDALTPASIPGIARRAQPGEPTVGVALESMELQSGVVNVLISRRNSSVTVETVEDKVLQTIANMEIEDEVELLISDAVDNLDLDEEIAGAVTDQLQGIDLSVQIAEAIENNSGSLLPLVDEYWTAQVTFAEDVTIAEQLTAMSEVFVEDALHVAGPVTLSGALRAAAGITTNGLTVSGSALVVGDLDVEGAITAGTLEVLDDVTVGGTLHASSLEVGSGATIDGDLNITGELLINGLPFTASGFAANVGDITFSSGATLEIGDIRAASGSLAILGDVEIEGELTVSKRQAGYALIKEHATGAIVLFDPAFTHTPVITASANVPVLYAVSIATQTGFSVSLADRADEDVTISWIALSANEPLTFESDEVDPEEFIFPVDKFGVPLSSSDIWNACIRNQIWVDENGNPFNCRRYHEETIWTHPDLEISFSYDPEGDPKLIVPEEYVIEVVDDEHEAQDQEETIVLPDEEESEETGESEETQESTEEPIEEEPVEDSEDPVEEEPVEQDESEESEETEESEESEEPIEEEPVEEEPVEQDESEESEETEESGETEEPVEEEPIEEPTEEESVEEPIEQEPATEPVEASAESTE